MAVPIAAVVARDGELAVAQREVGGEILVDDLVRETREPLAFGIGEEPAGHGPLLYYNRRFAVRLCMQPTMSVFGR